MCFSRQACLTLPQCGQSVRQCRDLSISRRDKRKIVFRGWTSRRRRQAHHQPCYRALSRGNDRFCGCCKRSKRRWAVQCARPMRNNIGTKQTHASLAAVSSAETDALLSLALWATRACITCQIATRPDQCPAQREACDLDAAVRIRQTWRSHGSYSRSLRESFDGHGLTTLNDFLWPDSAIGTCRGVLGAAGCLLLDRRAGPLHARHMGGWDCSSEA